MNYGQFLNMMPEALLVLWLLIVFVADFSLMKSERKVSVLGKLTAALLLCQTILMFGIQPSEAFGGTLCIVGCRECHEDHSGLRYVHRSGDGPALG